MAETTGIEWCDHTFNPWIGCTKLSPACDHCYAETLMDTRYGKVAWGAGKPRLRTSESNWRQPLRWNKAAAAAGVRRRVFCASLADVFDAEVPYEWRRDLFLLIVDTPHLDWLLLTKRPQVAAKWFKAWPMPPNVWLGTTVEDQKMADLRIPILLSIPAKVRFLSCEPLLGPVDLRNFRVCDQCDNTPHKLFTNDPLCPRPIPPHNSDQCPLHWWPSDGCDGKLKHGISWVIAGGESGPRARPSHPDWFRSLRDQCAASGVPFFFKQWGEWLPTDSASAQSIGTATTLNGQWYAKVGKKAAGATLDGRERREFPR